MCANSNMKENIQNVGHWRQAGMNVAMKGPGSLSAAIPSLNKEDLYKVVMNPDQAQRKGLINPILLGQFRWGLLWIRIMIIYFLVYLEMCRQ
jgi:hypothetical protein